MMRYNYIVGIRRVTMSYRNSWLFAVAMVTLATTHAQDFITSGDNTDPAWARLVSTAQHVVAAQSSSWGALGLRQGFPRTIDLSNELGIASVSIACHPDQSVTLVFQASDLSNTQFVGIPDSFFTNIENKCTVPQSTQSCQPQVDKWVFDSVLAKEDELADAINTCTGNQTQLLTSTGALLGGGAFAGMAALWAVQAFPGSTVSCITFDSAWSHIKVDQTFVRIFAKAVDFQRNTAKPASWYAGAQSVQSAALDVPGAGCTLNNILCKVEPYVELACLSYNPVLLAERFTGSAVLADGLKRAVVLWFEPISTAVFVFVNLENIFDSWLNPQQAQIQATDPFFTQELLNMDPALWGSTYQLYQRSLNGEPAVYTQFATAFTQLQQSRDRRLGCVGLFNCFNALSARASPTNVIAVGHGVGGAYAAVAGPWAAIAFPRAAVQVATIGAPAVIGNNLFYVMFNSLVGTPYALVNGRDPVPRYPACLTGVALGLQGGLYINDTLLEMQNMDPWGSEFLFCDNDLGVKDQDCSLYLNSIRRVTKVRVDIGLDAPLGGVTNSLNACPLTI